MAKTKKAKMKYLLVIILLCGCNKFIVEPIQPVIIFSSYCTCVPATDEPARWELGTITADTGKILQSPPLRFNGSAWKSSRATDTPYTIKTDSLILINLQ